MSGPVRGYMSVSNHSIEDESRRLEEQHDQETERRMSRAIWNVVDARLDWKKTQERWEKQEDVAPTAPRHISSHTLPIKPTNGHISSIII